MRPRHQRARAGRHASVLPLILSLLLPVLLLAGCGEDKSTDPHDHDDHDHDEPVAGNCGHIEAEGFRLGEPGAAAPIVSAWQDEQTGSLELRAGEIGPLLQLSFLDADSTVFVIADTCRVNHLDCLTADSSVISIHRDPGVQWSFRLVARAAGSTTLTLNCYHEDHVHFSCAPIPVTISPAASDGHRLSGRVRIVSALAGETGTPEGIRLFDEADGVRILLERGGQDIDSTLCLAGAWEFHGLADGDYRVWTRLPDGTREALPAISITGADVAADTLRLGPSGEIRTYPNPFAYSHGVGIEFNTATPGTATVRCLDLGGREVWSYSFAAGTGLSHIHWMGIDHSQIPLPAGAYWAVVDAVGGTRWNLVFKETATAR